MIYNNKSESRWFEFDGANISKPKKAKRQSAPIKKKLKQPDFKPTVHKKLPRFVEAVTNGASIADLKREFSKALLARLNTELQTTRPDLMSKLHGTPATQVRLIADECLSHKLTFALHAFGITSSMHVIGHGMKDKYLAPAMSRAGYNAIISLDKHSEDPDNDLCEIIKRARRDKVYALRNNFNMQNLPIVVLLPNDQKHAMLLLNEKRDDILDFLQNPEHQFILDLSEATPTKKLMVHKPKDKGSSEDLVLNLRYA